MRVRSASAFRPGSSRPAFQRDASGAPGLAVPWGRGAWPGRAGHGRMGRAGSTRTLLGAGAAGGRPCLRTASRC